MKESPVIRKQDRQSIGTTESSQESKKALNVQRALNERNWLMSIIAFEMDFGKRLEALRNKSNDPETIKLYDEILLSTRDVILQHNKKLMRLRKGQYEEKELLRFSD